MQLAKNLHRKKKYAFFLFQVFHPHGLQVHFNVSGAHPHHHHHGPPQDAPHAASGSEQFGQNQPGNEAQDNQQQLPRPQVRLGRP